MKRLRPSVLRCISKPRQDTSSPLGESQPLQPFLIPSGQRPGKSHGNSGRLQAPSSLHGIYKGLGMCQLEDKKIVTAGTWVGEVVSPWRPSKLKTEKTGARHSFVNFSIQMNVRDLPSPTAWRLINNSCTKNLWASRALCKGNWNALEEIGFIILPKLLLGL